MQRLRYLESKNFNISRTERKKQREKLCLIHFFFFFFSFRLILGVHGEFAAKNALLGQNSERGQLRFLKGASEEIARHLG